VDPDADGNLDSISLTWLIQVLKLNYGESPFYGDWGIPAHPSVVQQVFPDYYIMLTQRRFAGRFLSLAIAKQPLPTPTYNVTVIFHSGAKISAAIVPRAADFGGDFGGDFA
jgi:hypothetical protein